MSTKLSQKDINGYKLIAIAAVAIVAILLISAMRNDAPPSIDASTVILIDLSESVSVQTSNEMVNRVLTYIENDLKTGELVSIYTISDVSKKVFEPIFVMRKPSNKGNRLFENAQSIKKNYSENFLEPLTTAIKVKPVNSKESPIAHAVTDISLSTNIKSSKNTLLIFSDMLENTSEFSMYGCNPKSDIIASYKRSRRGGVERPTFYNTKIVLNIIPRIGRNISEFQCRDIFWPWFFGDNRGENAEIIVLHMPG